jgi:hypothetical protein
MRPTNVRYFKYTDGQITVSNFLVKLDSDYSPYIHATSNSIRTVVLISVHRKADECFTRLNEIIFDEIK